MPWVSAHSLHCLGKGGAASPEPFPERQPSDVPASRLSRRPSAVARSTLRSARLRSRSPKCRERSKKVLGTISPLVSTSFERIFFVVVTSRHPPRPPEPPQCEGRRPRSSYLIWNNDKPCELDSLYCANRAWGTKGEPGPLSAYGRRPHATMLTFLNPLVPRYRDSENDHAWERITRLIERALVIGRSSVA